MTLQHTYSDAETLTKEIIRYRNVEKALNELHFTHAQSYAHSIQATHLALTLGLLNNLELEKLEKLGIASALHDIGKTKTPLEILLKPGKLEKDELVEMHEHIRYGIEILEGMHFDGTILALVGSSHENQKNAYPRNINGKGYHHRCFVNPLIHKMSEILSVSDHASGLTEKRPYKGPLEKEKVISLLRDDFVGEKKLVQQASVVLGNGYMPYWNKIRF